MCYTSDLLYYLNSMSTFKRQMFIAILYYHNRFTLYELYITECEPRVTDIILEQSYQLFKKLQQS